MYLNKISWRRFKLSSHIKIVIMIRWKNLYPNKEKKILK